MSESRELVHAPRQSENLLQQVIAAAKDPNIDAAKMETLARLVNSQQDREREIEFNQSKNAAIMDMPVITKDGRIVITKDGHSREQGRFARWEDIDRVIRPILQRYNLALSFDSAERQGGGLTVTPILSHTNGYTQRGGPFPVPMEKSGSKNDAQAMGSSLAYGKRYSGCAMLNIVTEGVDDDGNQGRGVAVNLPFEREQLVREEAKAAFEAGTYTEFFSRQSPKDRAFLISSQLHVEYGGPALPAPDKRPQPPVQAGPEPGPLPEPDPPSTTSKRPTSAREWVDRFKEDLGKCQTVGFLDEYMDGKRDKLRKLHESDKSLEEEAQQAYRDRRAALEEGRLV